MFRSNFSLTACAIGLALVSSAPVFGATLKAGTLETGKKSTIKFDKNEIGNLPDSLQKRCPKKDSCSLEIMVTEFQDTSLSGKTLTGETFIFVFSESDAKSRLNKGKSATLTPSKTATKL